LESDFAISSTSKFFPSSKSFDPISEHSYAEQLEALRFEFDQSQARLTKELFRCTKLEDKGLRVLFAGYYKREETLKADYIETMKEHDRLEDEREFFQTLYAQESVALRDRLREAKAAEALQVQRDNQLQKRYAALRQKKEQMEQEYAKRGFLEIT
jgi:hypothetical protein